MMLATAIATTVSYNYLTVITIAPYFIKIYNSTQEHSWIVSHGWLLHKSCMLHFPSDIQQLLLAHQFHQQHRSISCSYGFCLVISVIHYTVIFFIAIIGMSLPYSQVYVNES